MSRCRHRRQLLPRVLLLHPQPHFQQRRPRQPRFLLAISSQNKYPSYNVPRRMGIMCTTLCRKTGMATSSILVTGSPHRHRRRLPLPLLLPLQHVLPLLPRNHQTKCSPDHRTCLKPFSSFFFVIPKVEWYGLFGGGGNGWGRKTCPEHEWILFGQKNGVQQINPERKIWNFCCFSNYFFEIFSFFFCSDIVSEFQKIENGQVAVAYNPIRNIQIAPDLPIPRFVWVARNLRRRRFYAEKICRVSGCCM